MPALAPHASDQAIAAAPTQGVHRLTLDALLQRSLEELARERARTLGPDLSVAIVALDNATGEVLARVASAGYFDLRRSGQVDMTQALRSPGSALKPFIYGLAFEDGLIHPETLMDDRPIADSASRCANARGTTHTHCTRYRSCGRCALVSAARGSARFSAVHCGLCRRVGAGRSEPRAGRARRVRNRYVECIGP